MATERPEEGCMRCKYCMQVLIIGHSYGDLVVRKFLLWADKEQPGWVDRYVATLINLAGPTLGTPKAVASLLSGTAWNIALGPPRKSRGRLFSASGPDLLLCFLVMPAAQAT